MAAPSFEIEAGWLPDFGVQEPQRRFEIGRIRWPPALRIVSSTPVPKTKARRGFHACLSCARSSSNCRRRTLARKIAAATNGSQYEIWWDRERNYEDFLRRSHSQASAAAFFFP